MLMLYQYYDVQCYIIINIMLISYQYYNKASPKDLCPVAQNPLFLLVAPYVRSLFIPRSCMCMGSIRIISEGAKLSKKLATPQEC